MIKEFKEFAVKGSVVDMAVGIMIGAALAALVASLVQDILMPPLSLMTGGLNFADQFIVLKQGTPGGPYPSLAQAQAAGATVISYGQFINTCVSFLMVSGVLFVVVRWINRLRRPDTPPAPSTRSCDFCKSIIDVTATRCAHCTSDLEPVSRAEVAG